MGQDDEFLRTLQQRIARKKQLYAMRKELQQQCVALAARAAELEKIKINEQADVDRLERGSLSAFFYNVIGRKEQMMDRERQEAYAAAVKYEAMVQELHRAEQDLQRCSAEIESLRGCEEQYASLFQEKLYSVKCAFGEMGTQVLQLEERIGFLENQGRELSEAIDAGEEALDTAQELLSKLGSAEGWGTWDMIGGGMVSSLVKHSVLDEAQEKAEQLESRLRRFRSELADVEIADEPQVNMTGSVRFLDCFFDNMFVDWMVLDKITQSKGMAEQTVRQIKTALDNLQDLLDAVEEEHRQLSEKLEEIVLNA